MKSLIQENKISTKYITLTGRGLLNPVAVLRDVKLIYRTEKDGTRSDEVVAVRYDCIDPESFSTFSIKVENDKPIITEEELELAENPVFIEIPLEQTLIKPYEVSYGSAKVSIVANFIKLRKDDE